MELATWLAYLGVITVLIATPGPSCLLVTLHGYQYGVKKANATIIGDVLGASLLMLISALGLGVLLTTSDTLFTLLKYIGAAYLIYLGIQTWRKPLSSGSEVVTDKQALKSTRQLFKQGLLTSMTNPKDLLFFAALFPAFLNNQAPLSTQLSLLMLTWVAVNYIVCLLYAITGTKVNKQFSNPSFMKAFNRFTGGMFVSFGALLAGANNS
ncbi:LysE family translocator [Leucothrix sargassi]|nr:LysE family translocator [Leucothrix sargassi]